MTYFLNIGVPVYSRMAVGDLLGFFQRITVVLGNLVIAWVVEPLAFSPVFTQIDHCIFRVFLVTILLTFSLKTEQVPDS